MSVAEFLEIPWHLLRAERPSRLDDRAMLGAWLHKQLAPRRLSVGWLLCGDERVGSSRIHGLNLHRYLEKHGVSSHVLHSPPGYVEALEVDEHRLEVLRRIHFDVVILQRVHRGKALQLVDALAQGGTKTAFFAADLYDTEVLRRVDCVFAASEELKRALVALGLEVERVAVVPDAIETPSSMTKQYRDNEDPRRRVRLAWMGAEGHWPTLQGLRHLLATSPELRDYELVTISNHPEADRVWRLDTVWQELLSCDIGVVPADTSSAAARVKSNNRVTAFKALGMPVVCARLPSYEQALTHGQDGYIADSDEEWLQALLALRTEQARKRVGLCGRDRILATYSLETIGDRFMHLLLALRDARAPRAAGLQE